MKSTIIIIALLFVCGTAASQTTYYVPDDYPTIQDAINASSNGDTIIVRPGTYVEIIDFVGKAVHLKSEKGPLVTSIVAGFVNRGQPSNSSRGCVVYFQHGEGRGSILEGFTVTGGNDSGIRCIGSSPSIRNDIITRNTAQQSGGGIYIESGDVLISGTIVEENSIIPFGTGGGIDSNNNSTLTITDSVIAGNHAGQNWGSGGGICATSTNITLTNTVVFRNYASMGGGIVAGYCSTTKLTNCVIVGNDTTGGNGSGLYWSNGVASVSNTIFWDNRPTNKCVFVGEGTFSISYSDVEGGQSSFVVGSGTLNWGEGMIDADPLFVDSNKRDLHLTWDSPCRNTGDNSVVVEPEDIEGDPRITFGMVDMGADEFYYHLYYADVYPGSVIDVKVVGYPTAPVTLFLGSGIADPPYSTQHGTFYLFWPPLWQNGIGVIPNTGVLTKQMNVPPGWGAGSLHPMQALVGKWGGAYTKLTNLMWLTVVY